MPRQRNWKWCEKKKDDWRKRQKADDDRADRETSRVESDDGGGSDSADKYESPPERGAASLPRVVAGSPSRVVAGSPSRVVAVKSPSRVRAGKKGNKGNICNTGKNKQVHAITDEETDISLLKQVITELNLLLANVSSNVQTDFDSFA